MLSLFTGLPGASKTLNLIKYLCETKQYKDRQVYYYNIEIFNFETLDKDDENYLDIEKFSKKKLALYDRLQSWIEIDEDQMREWYTLPAGSIVVCDEVQKLWRPRSSSARVPRAVEELETSRHLGIDLFFTSQFPMQIDTGVRKLVQYHKHLKRPANLKTIKFSQYEQCIDPERPGIPPLETGHFLLDSKYFGLYKSAVEHTHGARIPKKLYIVLAFFVFAIIFFIYLINLLSADEPLFVQPTNEQQIEQDQKKQQNNTFDTDAERYLSKYKTRVETLAYSAPIYDEQVQPLSYPRLTGCIQFSTAVYKSCQCTTQQGTLLNVPQNVCLNFIASNGQFDFSKEDINMDEYMADYLPTGEPCCSSGSGSDEQSNPQSNVASNN